MISKEHRANIEVAIKETEYKYFGMYEFTETQHNAVDLLVSVAQAMLDDDADLSASAPPAQSVADTAEELAALQERFNLVAAINASYVDEIRALRESITDAAGASSPALQRLFEIQRGYATKSDAPPAPSVADAAGASERERFEAWAIEQGYAFRVYDDFTARPAYNTGLMWAAWKAATAKESGK